MSEEFTVFINSVEKDIKEHTQKISQQIFDDVVDLTPVRTGYAQSRWELNTVSDDQVEVTNDCDYIIYLDQGSSDQAPAGMTAIALARASDK